MTERLAGAGHRVAVVGGAVRDVLRGRLPTDVDLATSATPEEVMTLFPEARPSGLVFGTVTVLAPKGPIHVTTFRSEAAYGDGRHPDAVVFTDDLEGDLARRDFTVNAMALLTDGSLVDPFGGQEDLESGLLRTVGEAERRFREDALRRLRLLRFVAEEGFDVERATLAALISEPGSLRSVAPERAWPEIRRLVLGKWAERAVKMGVALLREILPWTQPASFGPLPVNIEVRLAALALKADPEAVFKDLLRIGAGRIPSLHVARLVRLAAEPPADSVAIRRLGASIVLSDLEALHVLTGHPAFAEAAAARRSGAVPSRLRVDGHDLSVAFQKAPGPWVGRTLHHLWEAVLSEPSLNDEEQLLILAAEYLAKDDETGKD